MKFASRYSSNVCWFPCFVQDFLFQFVYIKLRELICLRIFAQLSQTYTTCYDCTVCAQKIVPGEKTVENHHTFFLNILLPSFTADSQKSAFLRDFMSIF